MSKNVLITHNQTCHFFCIAKNMCFALLLDDYLSHNSLFSKKKDLKKLTKMSFIKKKWHILGTAALVLLSVNLPTETHFFFFAMCSWWGEKGQNNHFPTDTATDGLTKPHKGKWEDGPSMNLPAKQRESFKAEYCCATTGFWGAARLMQSSHRRASQEHRHPRLAAHLTFHANFVLFMFLYALWWLY